MRFFLKKYIKAPVALLVCFVLVLQMLPAPQPAQASFWDTVKKIISKILQPPNVELTNEGKITFKGDSIYTFKDGNGIPYNPFSNMALGGGDSSKKLLVEPLLIPGCVEETTVQPSIPPECDPNTTIPNDATYEKVDSVYIAKQITGCVANPCLEPKATCDTSAYAAYAKKESEGCYPWYMGSTAYPDQKEVDISVSNKSWREYWEDLGRIFGTYENIKKIYTYCKGGGSCAAFWGWGDSTEELAGALQDLATPKNNGRKYTIAQALNFTQSDVVYKNLYDYVSLGGYNAPETVKARYLYFLTKIVAVLPSLEKVRGLDTSDLNWWGPDGPDSTGRDSARRKIKDALSFLQAGITKDLTIISLDPTQLNRLIGCETQVKASNKAPSKCVNPNAGKPTITQPVIPEECELRIKRPGDENDCSTKETDKERLACEEELIAHRAACTQFVRLQRAATEEVWIAKKIFNSTNPYDDCFFLKNCRSKCYLSYGEVRYVITWLDIAQFLLPTSWITVIKKIMGVMAALNEIKKAYDALKLLLTDGIKLVNNFFDTFHYLTNMFQALDNIGGTMSAAIGVAGVVGSGLESAGVLNIPGNAMQYGVGVGAAAVLTSNKGISSMTDMLKRFSDNLLRYSTAKSETNAYILGIRRDLTAVLEGDANIPSKGAKHEQELAYFFEPNSEVKKNLDQIVGNFQKSFKQLSSLLDNAVAPGQLPGEPVTELARGTAEEWSEFNSFTLNKKEAPVLDFKSWEDGNGGVYVSNTIFGDRNIKNKNNFCADYGYNAADGRICMFNGDRVRPWEKTECPPSDDSVYDSLKAKLAKQDCNGKECYQIVIDRTKPEYIQNMLDAALGCGCTYYPNASDISQEIVCNEGNENRISCKKLDNFKEVKLSVDKDAWKYFWERLGKIILGDDYVGHHNLSEIQIAIYSKTDSAGKKPFYFLKQIAALDDDANNNHYDRTGKRSSIHFMLGTYAVDREKSGLFPAVCETAKVSDITWLANLKTIFQSASTLQANFKSVDPNEIEKMLIGEGTSIMVCASQKGACKLDYSVQEWREYWENLARQLAPDFVKSTIGNADFSMKEKHLLIMERVIDMTGGKKNSLLGFIARIEIGAGNNDDPNDDGNSWKDFAILDKSFYTSPPKDFKGMNDRDSGFANYCDDPNYNPDICYSDTYISGRAFVVKRIEEYIKARDAVRQAGEGNISNNGYAVAINAEINNVLQDVNALSYQKSYLENIERHNSSQGDYFQHFKDGSDYWQSQLWCAGSCQVPALPSELAKLQTLATPDYVKQVLKNALGTDAACAASDSCVKYEMELLDDHKGPWLQYWKDLAQALSINSQWNNLSDLENLIVNGNPNLNIGGHYFARPLSELDNEGGVGLQNKEWKEGSNYATPGALTNTEKYIDDVYTPLWNQYRGQTAGSEESNAQNNFTNSYDPDIVNYDWDRRVATMASSSNNLRAVGEALSWGMTPQDPIIIYSIEQVKKGLDNLTEAGKDLSGEDTKAALDQVIDSAIETLDCPQYRDAYDNFEECAYSESSVGPSQICVQQPANCNGKVDITDWLNGKSCDESGRKCFNDAGTFCNADKQTDCQSGYEDSSDECDTCLTTTCACGGGNTPDVYYKCVNESCVPGGSSNKNDPTCGGNNCVVQPKYDCLLGSVCSPHTGIDEPDYQNLEACQAGCGGTPAVCPNGIAETGEDCDGSDLNGKTCVNLNQGYTGGTLSCKSDCTFKTSNCTSDGGCTSNCQLTYPNQCVGASSYKYCKKNTGDTCYDWVTKSCSSGQTCTNGSCVSSCTSGCTFGESDQCVGANSYKHCTKNINDSCYSWVTNSCGSGKTCNNGSCESGCTSECQSTDLNTCVGANQYKACVRGSDSCYSWVTNSCSSGKICSGAGNCVLPPSDTDECIEARPGQFCVCKDGESKEQCFQRASAPNVNKCYGQMNWCETYGLGLKSTPFAKIKSIIKIPQVYAVETKAKSTPPSAQNIFSSLKQKIGGFVKNLIKIPEIFAANPKPYCYTDLDHEYCYSHKDDCQSDCKRDVCNVANGPCKKADCFQAKKGIYQDGHDKYVVCKDQEKFLNDLRNGSLKDALKQIADDLKTNIDGLNKPFSAVSLSQRGIVIGIPDISKSPFFALLDIWKETSNTQSDVQVAKDYVNKIVRSIAVGRGIVEIKLPSIKTKLASLETFRTQLKLLIDSTAGVQLPATIKEYLKKEIIGKMDDIATKIQEDIVDKITQGIGEYKNPIGVNIRSDICPDNTATLGFLNRVACFEWCGGLVFEACKSGAGFQTKKFEELQKPLSAIENVEDSLFLLTEAKEEINKVSSIQESVDNLKPEIRSEALQLNTNLINDIEKKVTGEIKGLFNKYNPLKDEGIDKNPSTTEVNVDIFKGNDDYKGVSDGSVSFKDFAASLTGSPLSFLKGQFTNIGDTTTRIKTKLSDVNSVYNLPSFFGGDRAAQYQTSVNNIKDIKMDKLGVMVSGNNEIKRACSALGILLNGDMATMNKTCGQKTAGGELDSAWLLAHNDQNMINKCEAWLNLDIDIVDPVKLQEQITTLQNLRNCVGANCIKCPTWLCTDPVTGAWGVGAMQKDRVCIDKCANWQPGQGTGYVCDFDRNIIWNTATFGPPVSSIPTQAICEDLGFIPSPNCTVTKVNDRCQLINNFSASQSCNLFDSCTPAELQRQLDIKKWRDQSAANKCPKWFCLNNAGNWQGSAGVSIDPYCIAHCGVNDISSDGMVCNVSSGIVWDTNVHPTAGDQVWPPVKTPPYTGTQDSTMRGKCVEAQKGLRDLGVLDSGSSDSTETNCSPLQPIIPFCQHRIACEKMKNACAAWTIQKQNSASSVNNPLMEWPPTKKPHQAGETFTQGYQGAQAICIQTQRQMTLLDSLRAATPEELNLMKLTNDCSELTRQKQLKAECERYTLTKCAIQDKCGSSDSCNIVICENSDCTEKTTCNSIRTGMSEICTVASKKFRDDKYCSWPLNNIKDIISVSDNDNDNKSNAEAMNKLRRLCVESNDIATPLNEVMKVLSVLMGIQSGTAAQGGITSSIKGAQAFYTNAGKFIKMIEGLKDAMGKAYDNEMKKSAASSGGLKITPFKCIAAPAESYAGNKSQPLSGAKGGPVCPDVAGLYSQLQAQFSQIRQQLNAIDNAYHKNTDVIVRLPWDKAFVKLGEMYTDKYESIKPMYDRAYELKQSAQFVWALATALNFASENCTCGMSYCKIPFCISGLPLTLAPLKDPYCALVWTLRTPMVNMAERLEQDLNKPLR